MKKQSSSLIAKLLNENSQPVLPVQDAGRIVMRDAREILPNPKNGSYSMDSIEELAAMIQLTHNIEPVAVKELPDGTFMLTSGHRRRLAQIYRFEQGMVDAPLLPTITQEIVNEFSDVITDDEMETPNVVFPNKGQRRHLSPSEEAAEIELIRPILYKIYEHEKAAGNIQGKFRTFFAEVLQVSEATLHRKEAVGKVSEEIKAEVDAGNIKPTAAAALAGVDKEQQNAIIQSIKDKGEEVTVDAVNRAKRENKGKGRFKGFPATC